MAYPKRITPEIAEQILAMTNSGMSQRLIGEILGMSQGTISNFLNGRYEKPEPELFTGEFFCVDTYSKKVFTI